MKAKQIISKLLIVAFVVGFGVLCAFMGDINSPVGTLWSLFPPVIAIGLALITKEVYFSLFIGIVFGAMFYANFSFEGTIQTIFVDGMIAKITDGWNVGILIFLVMLGIMVSLMNKVGGSAAYGRWAATKIKGRKGAGA